MQMQGSRKSLEGPPGGATRAGSAGSRSRSSAPLLLRMRTTRTTRITELHPASSAPDPPPLPATPTTTPRTTITITTEHHTNHPATHAPPNILARTYPHRRHQPITIINIIINLHITISETHHHYHRWAYPRYQTSHRSRR